MQSPKNLYSPAAKELLRELGIDLTRFDTAFDRNLYASLGLSRSLFFAREAFGRDALVVGEALTPGDTPKRRQRTSGRRTDRALSALRGKPRAAGGALRSGARSAGRPRRRGQAPRSQVDELPRLSDADLRAERRGCELLSGQHARVLWPGRRRCAGGGCARPRLSGICRARASRRPQCGLGGALYLSLPRRQRRDRAPAGALARARRCARQHHGRRGRGAVRLRQARCRGERPYSPRLQPA